MTAPDAEPQRQFAIEIVEQLRARGYEALWAGGCVRDQLLGRTPKDYDVATGATPDQIRHLFGRHRTVAIGAAFGVITVVGRKDQGQIEVATFRQDAPYSDGRHPDSVRFSTAREDALRRDFTINGLFYDPIAEQVIDYVGGRVDLQRGIVRAIGDPDQRLAEDKLRMLRAIRFAATFDFTLDHATLCAVQRHADELQLVSAERIADEMRRMLIHARRVLAMQLLEQSALLAVVLPEVAPLPSRDDGGAWQRTLKVLDRLVDPSFPTALAALLREVASADDTQRVARQVARRWKLSNQELAELCHVLEQERVVRQAHQLPWPQVQRLLVGDYVDQLLQLAEAVVEVDADGAAGVAYCRQKLALAPEELNPSPLISGHDLLGLGIPRSPRYKTLLDSVRDAQLEQRVTTKQQALDLAQRLYEDG